MFGKRPKQDQKKNPKQMSKRDLIRHIELGKQLIVKVTKELSETKERNRKLYALLKESHSCIALLVFNNGYSISENKEACEYNLNKDDIIWGVQNLRISMRESLDGDIVTITAHRRMEDKNDENSDNSNRETDTEGDNDTFTSEESNIEELHSEEPSGISEIREDTGDTLLPGADSMDVQRAETVERVPDADSKDIFEAGPEKPN